ncbi:Ran GAP Rna1 [Tilletia horrida]|uniref:Ran GAP Rna1 n=1 Tax=Tilletia horrida TaxID=155126 RepID=A0AAN6GQW7_9BASI|nr:Ran GAP Rna1 [Tilletia horrida]KAK0567282.1 Ran GAP Rna1 [Tilletia horrida]
MVAPTDATQFSLLGQNLKLDSGSDIEPHLSKLSGSTQTIQLGGNTLGQEACAKLASALPPSLTDFDAADIFTGRLISEIPQSLAALSDALAQLPQLQEVNFSDNAFGGRCADAMSSLYTKSTSLQSIRLSNNGLGVTGGTIVAAALEQRSTSQLQSLIIGRNRLENGSAPLIARALAHTTHGKAVQEVRMPQNGIRMEGIEEICKALSQGCPNLRILDLQDNTLVFRGSRALARAIPSWPQLEVLNLSDTLLRSRGGSLIFHALAQVKDSKLHTLQLQYCELNRTALNDLADALDKGLGALKVLELHGNWADEGEDECLKRIQEAMERRGAAEGLKGLDELEPEAEEEEEEEEGEEGEEGGGQDDEGDDEEQEMDGAQEEGEAQQPTKHEVKDDIDDLANALSKTNIASNGSA